jgi:hypothetical protein
VKNLIVKKNRKGISTFIATLLLMVLAVAAGVVIYAYVMGYLGSFGGPQTMGSISLDTSQLNPSPAAGSFALTAYIRNIGHTQFIIDSVYLNGVKVQARDPQAMPVIGTPPTKMGYYFVYPSGSSIPENGVGILYMDQNPLIDGTSSSVLPNGFIGSTTYDLKIVGKDNTQLSFQIKK